ncbi:MAG: hypothetical protein QG652_1358 [Pseudomonadota bacterium]|nr:hypothetical protein [Pseudomonadota bacterium]
MTARITKQKSVNAPLLLRHSHIHVHYANKRKQGKGFCLLLAYICVYLRMDSFFGFLRE